MSLYRVFKLKLLFIDEKYNLLSYENKYIRTLIDKILITNYGKGEGYYGV